MRGGTCDSRNSVRSRCGPHGEVAEENPVKGGRGSEPRRRHGLRSIEGGLA